MTRKNAHPVNVVAVLVYRQVKNVAAGYHIIRRTNNVVIIRTFVVRLMEHGVMVVIVWAVVLLHRMGQEMILIGRRVIVDACMIRTVK